MSQRTSRTGGASAATPYSPDFFADIRDSARAAGQVVLPPLVELLKATSVVDVGCGTGGWCASALALGVHDILGTDGDYVDRSQLQIPLERFLPADLTQPLRLDRRFDLAICTEVAEHLPPERADSFVADLVALSPAIVFSAAIPGQGGTHHVNEQWPSYWASRFRAHGYETIDSLRLPHWGRNDMAWWYQQNLFLALDRRLVEARPELAARLAPFPREVVSLVHPEAWLLRRQADERLRNAPRALFGMMIGALRRRLLRRSAGR